VPDWRTIVEQHLAGLQLPAERREEICRELAAHLEDEHARLSQHLPTEEAEREAMRLLHQPQILISAMHDIHQEETMTKSTKAIWLPGLSLLGIYSLLLVGLGAAIVQGWVTQPRTILGGALVVLLLLGALGASWAKAAGATRRQRALVSVFPVLMPIAGILVIGPLNALLQGRTPFPAVGVELFPAVFNGVVIPACALLLGALPFLRNGVNVSEDSPMRVSRG